MITFVLTSGRPSPTLIEAGIKNFWLSMVFSYGIWIGISLSYWFTGQTDISKAFRIPIIVGDYNCKTIYSTHLKFSRIEMFYYKTSTTEYPLKDWWMI